MSPEVPGRTFFPNLSKEFTFAAAPLVLTPFVHNQRLVASRLNQGSTFTCVLDCCESSTLFRNLATELQAPQPASSYLSIYLSVYIYIYREREIHLSIYLSIYIYIYNVYVRIYVYMHRHMCVYIYIYTHVCAICMRVCVQSLATETQVPPPLDRRPWGGYDNVIYIYIYIVCNIFIYRERDIERERVCIYIYIYIGGELAKSCGFALQRWKHKTTAENIAYTKELAKYCLVISTLKWKESKRACKILRLFIPTLN